MRNSILVITTASLLLVTGGAFAQSTAHESVVGAAPATPKLAFEVASVKPAAPLDMQKLAAAMQKGGEMPKLGPHVDGAQAEYHMALRELIVVA